MIELGCHRWQGLSFGIGLCVKFMIQRNKELLAQISNLGGKRLACHCPSHLPCHGDILCELYHRKCHGSATVVPSDEQARGAAEARRDRVTTDGSAQSMPYSATWCHTREMLSGCQPLRVGSGAKRRVLVDGGGLCSPGMWRPSERDPISVPGDQIRRAIESFFAEQCLDEQVLLASSSKAK